jgi:type II secretory pathway pseudopilin PulG
MRPPLGSKVGVLADDPVTGISTVGRISNPSVSVRRIGNPSYAKMSRAPALARRRPGFSLVEMVALMWALGLAMVVGAALLVGVIRTERAAAASYRRLADRGALADQFRDDVGQAAAAPDRMDEWTAGPTCLLLMLADGRRVTYCWDDGHLERSEQRDARTFRRYMPLGIDSGPRPVPAADREGRDMKGTEVEFTRTGNDGRILTLRVSEPPAAAGVASRPVEIVAALGGDVR